MAEDEGHAVIGAHEQLGLRLARFEPAQAEGVLGWAQTPAELFHWCGREDFPLTDPAVFDAWHADPGAHAYTLADDGDDGPIAYGETWFDDRDGTAELARLIVAPDRRRQGFAHELIDRLCDRVARAGFAVALMRVTPTNEPAIMCYRRAGFLRLAADEQRRMNESERRAWVWMRRVV
jgi:ribosomal protein S18 acetylase RimI-like enzyme